MRRSSGSAFSAAPAGRLPLLRWRRFLVLRQLAPVPFFRKRSMSGRVPVCVPVLKHLMMFIAAGDNIGQEIENLFSCELVEQSLRHNGRVGLFPFNYFRFLEDDRL